MNTQLSVSLSRESVTRGDELLFLEQEDYNPYTGKLTKGTMVIATLGWLYPDVGYSTSNNCGGSEGRFTITVYAYLYQQDLVYNIALSYGDIGEAVIQDTEYSEVIKCNLKESVDFSYPSEGIISSSWVGNAYDSVGNIVTLPTFTSDNRSIFFSKKVYGSLRVKYKVTRHCYSVSIAGRQLEDDTVSENKYQSVAYATWAYDIDWIEIKSPEGFEAFDGDCGGGVIINPPPKPEGPPKAPPSDKDIHVDYCTQEVKE